MARTQGMKNPAGLSVARGVDQPMPRSTRVERRLAKKHRWKIVNASGTKQEVHKEILKIIFKKIGS